MDPQQTTQNRKSVRRRIGIVLEIHDRKTGKPLGRVMDLSNEGFMLLIKERINFDEKFDLMLPLPELIKFQRSIELMAECRWCQPSNTAGYFGAGFSIVSISLPKRDAWLQFVEEF